MFEVVKDWPKLPANMKVGDASSFAIDAQDNVWMIHRPHTLKGDAQKMAAKPVVVFDAAGNVLKQWGGEGQGYEWPQREHGIFIDYQGNVWLGGNNCPGNGAPTKPVNDDQLLKFSPDGRFLLQIGKVNGSKGNADTANLHRPADAQVHQPTNELFVADGYGNDRVIVFDANTGAYKRMWGAFGKAAKDEDSCEVATPRTFASPGPDNFNVVHAIRVSKDGMVYVADRENRRVQVFDTNGKYRQSDHPDRCALRPQPRPLTRCRAAVSLCRRRQGRVCGRSQVARHHRFRRARGHRRSRPPDQRRFQGQSLYRRDRHGHAEARL